MCVLQAGSEPGIYIAKLDLAQLRRYRETEAHGNAFRRPKLYIFDESTANLDEQTAAAALYTAPRA